MRTGNAQVIRKRTTTSGTADLPLRGTTMEIEAEFKLGTAERFGLIVRSGANGQGTKIGYDRTTGRLYVDRTASGVAAGPTFAGIQSGPLRTHDGKVSFTLYLDTSSVEVFGGQGETVITDQIFPDAASDGLKTYAENGSAQLLTLKAWKLNSIWH
ncbi:GH32 C-terminal domain-containing protein [Streptosporangium sp. LJ11]|uniref:GH32 C-terminal domain-containing protein n=1 Tax=Streptosporangium sp. LJ11 TaxID=3436927 RepID=UPI003F799797